MKRCLNCGTLFTSHDWRCAVCGFAPEFQDGIPIFAPALAEYNDTYGAAFFAQFARLEAGHFWFEARNQLIAGAVRRWFPEATTFFEIGCGTGFVLTRLRAEFPEMQLSGSDLLVEGLRFAAGRVPDATFLQMDARAIPYSGAFDAIGAFDVIEHIDEDETALQQMHDALRPGGGLLISVPQHRWLWSSIDDMSYHKRRYTRDELVSKVQRAGFTVLETTSFVSLLVPAMYAMRRLKAENQAQVDLFAEFRLPPAVNRGLSAVMGMELALHAAGVRFRWGGSRLLVARRS